MFILAFNSAFAAILSWILLKERPHSYTLAAITVMIGGVLLIVSDGISRGHWAGDLAALLSAIFIATAITVSRASGRDMGLTALSGAIIPALVGAAMVWQNGYQIENPAGSCSTACLLSPPLFTSWQQGRDGYPARKWRCSTCWKPGLRRSGSGSSLPRRQPAGRWPVAPC